MRDLTTVVSATLINTTRGTDGCVVIEIRGELDLADSERLRQVLVDASLQRPTEVVVDLVHVTFIDSSGIGALVAGYNAARGLGVRFAVRQFSPFILTQLRQTGLDEMLIGDR